MIIYNYVTTESIAGINTHMLISHNERTKINERLHQLTYRCYIFFPFLAVFPDLLFKPASNTAFGITL